MIILKILLDYHIIISLISVLAVWKWGDWRNWNKYYPTILFYISGDLFYHLLAHDKLLWNTESPFLKSTIADILNNFVVFPTTILLFLPNFPQSKYTNQVLYILMWVLIYSLWEFIGHYLGYFSYDNGWGFGWSVLFNVIMFPLLLLHHKRPLYAILGAIIVAFAILQYFDIPVYMNP